jgi:hypothetical protein
MILFSDGIIEFSTNISLSQLRGSKFLSDRNSNQLLKKVVISK